MKLPKLESNESSENQIIIDLESDHEGVDPIKVAAKHRNTPGPIDHTYRVDVMGKTLMRQLFNLVINKFSEDLKGKKQPHKFFPKMLNTIKIEYPQ